MRQLRTTGMRTVKDAERRLCASVYAGPRSRAVAEGGSWIDSGSASRAGAVVIEDDSLVR